MVTKFYLCHYCAIKSFYFHFFWLLFFKQLDLVLAIHGQQTWSMPLLLLLLLFSPCLQIQFWPPKDGWISSPPFVVIIIIIIIIICYYRPCLGWQGYCV